MTDMNPRAAAIVYATADLFVPPPHGLSGATVVPCTETKVHPQELAIQLICVALAEMISQGTVTLQVVEETKMFVIHTKNVVLHIMPGAETRLPQTGFSGWLTPSILANNGGHVHRIVWAAYGRDYPAPSTIPPYFASQELISLGFYTDTVQEIGGVGGMLRKAVHASTTQHVPVPICEQFAALRASAAPAVQQMLQSVSAHDPVLWEMLHKQVGHAIQSRVEQTDTANVG
jgi:hypothetical protein